MNHKQAIEKAAFVLVHSALDTQTIYLIDAKQYAEAVIASYLAARDCVLMPRKCDDDLASVGAVANDFISLYGVKNIYTTLIAEVDRREREEGK